MREGIVIEAYPVFGKGTFRAYPELFEPYLRNQPAHIREKYRKARRTLPKFEGSIKWQTIRGTGFCASIHPGSAKVFHALMTGAAHPIYVSDCLYINLRHRIFALSDPPGMTTLSRSLLEALDRYLKADPRADLEAIINRVNREAGEGLRDRATLSLLHLPPDDPNTARLVLAGDSYLWHGSGETGELRLAQAVPNRWGTPNMELYINSVPLKEGDFFLLATDGVIALRYRFPDEGLEEALARRVRTDGPAFAERLARECNDVLIELTPEGRQARFAGGDDLAVVLVHPRSLPGPEIGETYILGGYVI